MRSRLSCSTVSPLSRVWTRASSLSCSWSRSTFTSSWHWLRLAELAFYRAAANLHNLDMIGLYLVDESAVMQADLCLRAWPKDGDTMRIYVISHLVPLVKHHVIVRLHHCLAFRLSAKHSVLRKSYLVIFFMNTIIELILHGFIAGEIGVSK